MIIIIIKGNKKKVINNRGGKNNFMSLLYVYRSVFTGCCFEASLRGKSGNSDQLFVIFRKMYNNN